MNVIFKSFTFLTPFIYFIVSSCSPGSGQNKFETKPNIVLLFADDLGYGDLSVFGHPTIKTPNLDRMAAEGVKLTQFYVAASVCTPSRAGLMTGRLPIRNGMCGGRTVFFPDTEGGLPQEEITMAEILKTKNYATACFGKWHLGHAPAYLPASQGFDEYFGIPYSNDMSPAQNKSEGARNFPPTPLIEGTEIIENEPDQRLLTTRYTEHAVRFIGEHRDNPFFLYLPYTFPHTPLYASENFDGSSKRGLYGDVVQEIDWSVGEILNALKEHNLEENTFIFFTSDNGPWLVMEEDGGSAGILYEGKGSTWEGGMREPAIARFPGRIEAGSICTAVATTLDLLPTFAGLAGAELPADRILDGVDIFPVMTGQKETGKDTVFFYKGRNLFAIRKGAWKAHFVTVVKPYGPDGVTEKHDPPLLFNVETDPSEKYNRAAEHPEIIMDILAIKQRHQAGLVDVPTRIR
ncbi:MAG: sulfatase [Cyclobacteriaceae bacterium]|nr:sulfatase [Cyclobacteriaceae bacterium]